MIIKNEKEFPKVFYALHMAEGVAQYNPEHGDPYKVFIGEDAILNMSTSFVGKPVYVGHIDGDGVDLDTLKDNADGYVIDSFFNKSDGKHWVKIIIITDKSQEAIRSGWKVSNAYRITSTRAGGTWHGVDYEIEVENGVFDHLAIVDNPRYAESIILNPQEFKDYNKKKEDKLLTLENNLEANIKNSNGEKMKFNLFKKSKVKDAEELSELMVTLPSSEKTYSIATLINMADEDEKKKKENEEKEKEEKENEEEDEKDKKENEEKEKEEKENEEEEDKKENEDEEEEDKKENDEDDIKSKKVKVNGQTMTVGNLMEKYQNLFDKKTKKNNYEILKNVKSQKEEKTVYTSLEKTKRGRDLYGS